MKKRPMVQFHCSKCGRPMKKYIGRVLFFDVFTGKPIREENYYCDNHFFRKWLVG